MEDLWYNMKVNSSQRNDSDRVGHCGVSYRLSIKTRLRFPPK